MHFGKLRITTMIHVAQIREGMMIRASEAFPLNVTVPSTVSILHAAFLHPYFYTKSAYLNPLYLPLHFRHVIPNQST